MTVPWDDEQTPHEPEVSAAQIEAVRRRLGKRPCRVLDLGCGTGRVLLPLARDGHRVVGVESDPEAARACREAARDLDVAIVERDFHDFDPEPGGFDVILILGNTLMTVADVDVAAAWMRRMSVGLAPGSIVLIDDIPGLFWPDVAGGNWVQGLAEEEGLQLIWDERDAVFALRSGDEVDPDDWSIGPGDRRLRLWTDGALRLLAAGSGLSGPERDADGYLLVLHRHVTP